MNRKSLILAMLMIFPAATFGKEPAKRTKSGKMPQKVSSVPSPVAAAMKDFRQDAIRGHLRFLSDDLLEGRGPGTRGGQLAINYLASQLESLGLEPAGEKGTYLQRVPLVGVDTTDEKTRLTFTRGADKVEVRYLDDYVITDETQKPSSDLDFDLVFAGHGVVAPEYNWNDYQGFDVRGKVVVLLVDDPPASAAEPNLFGGKARTYYGRWSYKYEEALRQGASGAILIHTEPSAGYGWQVVRNSWGKERSYVRAQAGKPALTMTSWVTESAARRLFTLAGKDLDQLTKAAHTRDFRAVPLGVRATGRIETTTREVDTSNVLGRIPGSDPNLRDEAVIYSAHHDHLGIGMPEDGDTIYNGAIDNASGMAVLLEMARVWSGVRPPPKRSIVFAFVAAEEQGLRGSEYYASNPLIPPGKTALVLNFDSIEQIGKVENVTMVGAERTTFFPTAKKVTKALGIRIDPDAHPEQGHYYRSDHFSFAKVGIPAFSVKPGGHYVGRSKEWGEQQFKDHNENRYHQPDDEFDSKWDFSEGVQIGRLGFWLGWEAAQAAGMPTWNKGDEFLAARVKSRSR